MDTTRAEHLEWCKKRALEYVEIGQFDNAFSSMSSNLRKHPETEKHAGIVLGLALLMGGKLSTAEETRKFIEGFN